VQLGAGGKAERRQELIRLIGHGTEVGDLEQGLGQSVRQFGPDGYRGSFGHPTDGDATSGHRLAEHHLVGQGNPQSSHRPNGGKGQGGCRQVAILAARRSAFHPFGNEADLFLAESGFVTELAKALHRIPRRHPAFEHFLGYRTGPGPGFVVSRQGERRRAPGAMTTGAALLD